MGNSRANRMKCSWVRYGHLDEMPTLPFSFSGAVIKTRFGVAFNLAVFDSSGTFLTDLSQIAIQRAMVYCPTAASRI